MIASLAADFHRLSPNQKATPAGLRERKRLIKALVACEPRTAQEVEIQLEAVIAFCGFEHSEALPDVLARDVMRNAARFLNHRSATRLHVA